MNLDEVLDLETYESLRSEGMTDQEIAEEFWTTSHKLKRWVRKKKGLKLTVQKYEELKRKGYEDQEIAEMFHMSHQTVLLLKKKHGLFTKYQNIKIDPPFTPAEYLQMKQEGLKDDDICKKFNTSNVRLIKWKKDNGLSGIHTNMRMFKESVKSG